MTVHEFADALCIALAKRGARVKVKESHSRSVYLVAKFRTARHTIRVSDHPPGKSWLGGDDATDVWPWVQRKGDAEALAESIFRRLKNGP